MLRDAHYADAMILMAGPGVMASGQWISNAGEGREAMVWRDDCVASAVAVLTSEGHEGQIYNITGPDLQTFAEVTALMAEITGVYRWNTSRSMTKPNTRCSTRWASQGGPSMI
jgi:NAD(P)H dehydrogenase (quinone)